MQAYGCELEKSWLPYEWFDCPKKLNYPGLLNYPAWYLRLKGEFVLKLSEWKACKHLFVQRGMLTFADWLQYYNNQKMRAFYAEKGIDILKDAVSFPGVSMHCLLRGMIERVPELFSPCKEAYDMLKGAVVGSQSLVFKRYHAVGETTIHPHRFSEPKPCWRVIGYDANALYLSTMLREMPCGKEAVVCYDAPAEAVSCFTERLKAGAWFGFTEVDIEKLKPLWMKFEEMPPFFYTKQVHVVPQHIKAYCHCTGRTRGEGKKLVGVLSAQKLLLNAPLLGWYVKPSVAITAVHRTIDYQMTKIFTWFVAQVTEARHTGDTDKNIALLAEVFKLLGNSAYRKMLEAVERQTCVVFTKDEKLVDRALCSAYFEDLDELSQAYELKSWKRWMTINRPFQIGIAVYQLAKRRMLEFYYNFFFFSYFSRRDFELIQMDTDSNYLAISADRMEDIVCSELHTEIEATKKDWLAWDRWSGRTPGLFKLECEGSCMFALCSKCYYVDEQDSEKKKFSTCRSARILSPGVVSKQPLKVAPIEQKTEDSE